MGYGRVTAWTAGVARRDENLEARTMTLSP
jgi:hypothetical protein